MPDAPRYFASWESYWSTLTGAPGEVIWDADPLHAAQQDWPRLAPCCDPRLPLLDLGCGNGTQTRFLAQHVGSVIGVDISPAALAIARATNAADNISYRVLDLLVPEDVARLHAEIGVYFTEFCQVFHAKAATWVTRRLPPWDRVRRSRSEATHVQSFLY